MDKRDMRHPNYDGYDMSDRENNERRERRRYEDEYDGYMRRYEDEYDGYEQGRDLRGRYPDGEYEREGRFRSDDRYPHTRNEPEDRREADGYRGERDYDRRRNRYDAEYDEGRYRTSPAREYYGDDERRYWDRRPENEPVIRERPEYDERYRRTRPPVPDYSRGEDYSDSHGIRHNEEYRGRETYPRESYYRENERRRPYPARDEEYDRYEHRRLYDREFPPSQYRENVYDNTEANNEPIEENASASTEAESKSTDLKTEETSRVENTVSPAAVREEERKRREEEARKKMEYICGLPVVVIDSGSKRFKGYYEEQAECSYIYEMTKEGKLTGNRAKLTQRIDPSRFLSPGKAALAKEAQKKEDEAKNPILSMMENQVQNETTPKATVKDVRSEMDEMLDNVEAVDVPTKPEPIKKVSEAAKKVTADEKDKKTTVKKGALTKKRKLKKSSNLIGISAPKSGIGCTHHALSLAYYLARCGYKTCYFATRKRDTDILEAWALMDDNLKRENTYYKCDKLIMYPWSTPIQDIINRGYQFIIMDFGPEFEISADQFLTKDLCIVTVGARMWELPALHKGISEGLYNNVKVLMNFADKKEQREFKNTFDADLYFAEYEPDIFGSGNDAVYNEMLESLFA
ncbi:MAG: hypothetical protein PUF72_05645 [Clostridiales bacterium]|nr:hypothetical protein [Clostridiales bacterium]